MCEFCHKHGEGKKWYLEAKNYSEQLLSDARRRKFIEEFLTRPEALAQSVRSLDKLAATPAFVRRVITWFVVRSAKKHHFGQVVPIEDVERILGFTNSVVRLSCICRYAVRGIEGRYCFAVSMSPDGGRLKEIMQELTASYLTGPNFTGLERLSKETALKLMRDCEQEGLCHTVWTFVTPFIAGICNCDRADCLAMRATVVNQLPVMFRAEYVAGVNADLCAGCRECMRVCQFGAIGYSVAREKAEIDISRCYGCGTCRSVCVRGAIALADRRSVARAKSLW